MGSWIFRTARRVCMAAFAADIFIHAVIGASTINGAVRGTLSMLAMLALLAVLSRNDASTKVKKDRHRRQEGREGNA